MTKNSKHWTNFSAWHFGSWCCITIPSWVTKLSAVQMISSRQTLTNILNLWCDHVVLVIQFFNRKLQLVMIYYQTKFACKWTCSLEDTAEIVIFWLHKASLQPWHWRRWTNFSAWHSGSSCCITIPGLVIKWCAVQNLSSRQTFTDILNLPCDLDFEFTNQNLPQDIPAYDVILSNQAWLHTDEQFRKYRRNSHILII